VSDIRDDAREGFRDAFGYAASGLWSSPGALTLLGTAGADALALSFAVNRRAVVALGTRDDSLVQLASAADGELARIGLSELSPDRPHGWSALPLGVVWALGEAGADLAAVPGVDVYLDSDVPPGIGLADAAAPGVALALALNDAWRLDLSRDELAAVVQRAEGLTLDHPSASASVLAALHGHPDRAVIVENGGFRGDTVDLGLATAGLAVVIIGTDASSPARGDDEMHDTTENERVRDAVLTLREHGPTGLGAFLTASHESLQSARAGAGPETQLAVETALAAGALGARAGDDGTVLALVAQSAVSRLQVAIDGAFAEHGFGQPSMTIVVASHAAVRE
jgi:galactokinase